jgi:hypothetical protein
MSCGPLLRDRPTLEISNCPGFPFEEEKPAQQFDAAPFESPFTYFLKSYHFQE